MATDLIDLLGGEIVAYAQNRISDREFSGYAGSHGLTSMLLGSRGREVVVRGIVRGEGKDYAAAREDAVNKMDVIEALQWQQAADYYLKGENYYSVVWIKLEKVPDGNGVVYKLNSEGTVLVQFVLHGRSLAE
jgi:hypothetical protein